MNEVKLGQKAEGGAERDAIHIAVAPVVAAQTLEPGEHVGLGTDGRACRGVKPLGVVDPYLRASVRLGERFYLLLYPNTIVGLRHQWSHPAFDDESRGDDFIREAAAEMGITYDELMEAANQYLDSGEVTCLGSERYQDFNGWPTFWERYRTITGRATRDVYDAPFRCAC